MNSILSDLADRASTGQSSFSQIPDFICFSHLRWHFVTQRPQHLLTLAARHRRVFYWEEPIWHQPGELATESDGRPGNHLEITQEAPTLWVLRPHMTWGIDFEEGQRTLLTDFMSRYGVDDFVLWYYTPMALGFSGHLKSSAIVYDCMDELKSFLNPPPQLALREDQLFDKADIVFTGGISLYEAKRTRHSNVHAFPSSIDASHFAQAKNYALPEPADQACVAHPRAGFYGVIDERFDIQLLAAIAELRPEIQFVILGPVVKIDPETLPRASNIHYLGSKSYRELPAYLAGWDVALLPFALNEATRFISPTKTPEYLAAGRPVVSTPIRDVVRGYGNSGLVAIAEKPNAFALAIDQALLPPSKKWHEAVAAKLAQSSWLSTWHSMCAEIDRVLKFRSNQTSALQTSHRFLPGTTVTAISQLQSSVSKPRALKLESFDYLIIGAGSSGSMLAEQLTTRMRKRVLIIDDRADIGGSEEDAFDVDGLMVRRCGPRIFHISATDLTAYLSLVMEAHSVEHLSLADADLRLLPLPIRLDTVDSLYTLLLESESALNSLAVSAHAPRELVVE